MKKYTVYFEIGGRKMRSIVLANSEIEAKQRIADKITFHKIEEEKIQSFENIDFGEMEDVFNSIFGNSFKTK
jgi:hypothetical protein